MMSPSHRTDFAVQTPAGRTVQTFNTRERAIAFANANASEYGRLTVERVAYRVTRTTIHTAESAIRRERGLPPPDADLAMPGWS